MCKKLISLLCILAIIPSLFTSAVKADEAKAGNEDTVQMLRALNLLSEEDKMTHDSFILSLAGFLYENPAGSAEEIARHTGMIGATEEYNASKVITFKEAIRYAIVTLGYESRAELQGGYPDGYLKVASELGLTKKTYTKPDGILLLEEAAKILYEMTDTAPMVAYYKTETDKGYAIEENETLLSLNRGIYEINGVFTANENTSLYREEGSAEGTLVIDETTYAVSDECNKDLLGYNVTAYVKRDNTGEETVLYIEERENKNEILTIDGEMIEEVAEDFSKIEYLDGSEKQRYAKLALVPKVIFNGVYFDGYTTEDLSPDVGSITLVDNNDDGRYEIVKVTSYQTVAVESINSIENIIYNRYKFEGCIDKLVLDEEESDFVIFDAEGNKTELAAIKTGDILSVKKSRDEEGKLIEIYISGKENFSEKVSSVDKDNMEITIGTEKYKMTEEFLKYVADTNKSTTVGEKYTFYTDVFNNVVYMESYIVMEYKLFYRTYEEDEKYYVVYLDINNEWKTSVMADKLTFGKEKSKDSVVYEMIKDIDPQVVKLQENNRGEVTKIETSVLREGYSENEFTKSSEASYTYRLNPNAFNMSVYIEDDAKLFVLPKDKNNKDEYYVRAANGFFTADRTYTFVAYDVDEYGFCPLFTITETDKTKEERANKGLFIVTGIEKKEVSGEILSVVKGNYGEYKNLTIVGNTLETYDGIKVGDVLNIGLNPDGRANYVKKILSLNEFSVIDPANYYNPTGSLAGVIEKIDLEKGRFKVNCGTSVAFRISPDTSVQIYNRKTGKCEMKNASELHAGDKVVCRISIGRISEMACVREY